MKKKLKESIQKISSLLRWCPIREMKMEIVHIIMKKNNRNVTGGKYG